MPFKKGHIPHNKTDTNSKCKFCGEMFHISPSRLKDKKTRRGVYCSKKCADEARVGQPPWNKGKKIGFIPTGAFKKGNIPWNWKHGKASYDALHNWVRRRLGEPKQCFFCGATQSLVWANKSHKYKWELVDWFSLCTKCHGKYDSGKNRGAIKKTFRPHL